MHASRLLIGIIGLLLSGQLVGRAGELPQQIKSSVCRTVPEIDGVIGDDEWKDVPPIEFAWSMVQRDKPTTIRECQLRVMNSANGLYIALRVPDATVNNSLSPLNVDFALVAFARSAELRDGDDRKLVVPGLYADKHFSQPGKDEDDKQQDGRGAMTHDKSVCSIEWAIPLDSGDAQDVQAKPGDTLRWNLTFFDAFQADLVGTTAGVAWGGNLDHAADWGQLQLAADAPDDGGQAFKGPAWVETLLQLQKLPGTVAPRLRLVDSSLVSQAPDPVAKAQIEYTFLDTEGREQTAKAKLYFPASVRDGTTRVPLYYAAGYELDDGSSVAYVRRGFVVVSPRDLKANPLVQTPNPDVALLHIARSLLCVDDARVVIGGGSAGGYMTLMLAAETFPLAGAAADVPPVNGGYNAAYFLQRKHWPSEPKPAELPVFSQVAPIADQAAAVYADNTDDAIWFRNCPLAQMDTITCPVLVYWSTADMLVPIDQVGKSWVRPFDAQAFPPGFTQDPEKLSSTPEGRLRAMDVLSADDYELFVLPEEQIKSKLSAGNSATNPCELPFSRTKRWSITILDEGAPEPQVGHVKHAVPWTRNQFIDYVAQAAIQVDQLTAVKLQRLMDRYAGKDWLPTRLKHLDRLESERADVIRGLQLYVSASPAHAAHFTELYGQLPDDRKALEPAVLATILQDRP
ncbi:MAG: alpha/beta hydrolase family protein [Pirellulaceae bacterium]